MWWSSLESAGRSGHWCADRLALVASRIAIILILSLAACTSRPPSAVQERVASAPEKSPDKAISDLQQSDPGSPVALSDHLEYADQLIGGHADCQKRLGVAQSELDVARADPALNVVIPLGNARLADLQFRLHAARASCTAAASQRESELQQALAAAQQAVDLYRDALDYESMTIAQFNVAVTQRRLGDNTGSLASLEAAVALDKEFGLHKDAVDNAGLLARWRGDADPPAADFPTRSVTLKSWQPGDAEVNVEIDEATVVDGGIIRDQAHRTFAQRVRRENRDWVVSYEPGAPGYEMAQWPQEETDVRELAMSFERGLGMPAFRIDSKGNFENVMRLNDFSTEQLAAAHALSLDHMGSERDRKSLRLHDLQMMKMWFHPMVIRMDTAEEYNLQVGMWGGATLEQGVWYKLAAPLTLPGAPQLLIPSDIEFAYTRDVPCTGAATQRSCVEIVVRSGPQAEAIRSYFADRFDYPLVKPNDERVHYWSSTYIRIVTDPETLRTRVYDVRRYWHVSVKKAVDGPVRDRSERIVTTFAYP